MSEHSQYRQGTSDRYEDTRGQPIGPCAGSDPYARLRRHQVRRSRVLSPSMIMSTLEFLRQLRDDAAVCDGCGRIGTIARTTRYTDPPSILRYCRDCWPRERQRRAQKFQETKARIGIGDPQRLPGPFVAEALESCSWLDVEEYLDDLLKAGPVGARVAADMALNYVE